MIVQSKGGGKKIHLSEEEITLDKLRECSDMLHAPNVPLIERVTEVYFPLVKTLPEDFTQETLNEINKNNRNSMNEEIKLYEVLADEASRQLEKAIELNQLWGSEDRVFPEGTKLKDLEKEKVSFTKVYIEGIGYLDIRK